MYSVDNVHCNSYLNNYRARIPTNSSNESSSSMHYKQLWNEEKKKYSFSFNESNFCNNYSNSLKGSLRSIKSKGKSDLFCNTKNEKQFINVDEIAKGKDTRTTLMIRNIPIKYTDDMLINEMKKFENKYDCLYMPYDFEKGGNKGYAFINFTHPLNILLFYTSFEGKSWTYFESKKICELNFANFQGINEIKKHARNYKGLKKPTFFIITDDLKTNIEVPDKFLNDIKENYPKMKYIEKKQSQTILIKTLT